MGTGTAGPLAPTAALGDPKDRFRAVRVAGTAGKGSGSTCVASLLRAHGFRVGTHTGALARGLFADRVDHGVIGTGVGGLLDPTDPTVRADGLALITPIGPAHRDLPVATVREIAAREAGVPPVGGRAVEEADDAVPVEVSGSSRLLAAVHGTTVPR